MNTTVSKIATVHFRARPRDPYILRVAVFLLCLRGGLALAIDVNPIFTLDSNLSNVAFTVEALGQSDFDSASFSGTLGSILTIDPSAATPRISGLNLTGGRVAANNQMSFDINPGFGINIHVDAVGIVGTVNTPSPPASINSLGFGDLNHSFDASQHLTTFNEGSLNVSGSATTTIDLASNNIGGFAPGGTNGTINLTQGSTIGNLTTFHAQMNFPVQFTSVISVDAGAPLGFVDTNIQASGQLIANASFAVDIGLAESAGGNPLLQPIDPILAVDLDGDSSYPSGEAPQNAIDRSGAKYLNFGKSNSGFIVSPSAGSSVVRSFQITTADDVPERDPSSWQLYGTNDPVTSSDNSTGTNESWTLLDSGPVSLPQSRNTVGPLMAVDNSDVYSSYYMVFNDLKNAGATDAMQIGEVQFFGDGGITTLPSIFLPGDPIIAIDTDGNSSYPIAGAPNGPEPPGHAVDGTLAKYLNFGEENSGFIATPSTGGSVVKEFRITTANDASERDPTTWELYGTKDSVTSSDNSAGTNENWVLIDTGSVALPDARDTLGPLVTVANNDSYTSYRMLFTGIKNAAVADSMQIAEIEFFGNVGIHETPGLLSAADVVLAVDTDGNSSYPAEESPAKAVDGTNQKYLNFGDLNSGLIITPVSGASVIESFQLSTPNDFENRDPSGWQLFGTTDPVTSADNSTGLAENWSLMDSGAIALPTARNTLGPLVTVANTTTYSSYRLIFTDLKGGLEAGEMQIGELKFFGTVVQDGEAILTPGDAIIAIDAGGNSSYPAEESPANAIDGTLDKYLNFGEINSGFIVTPALGPSFVESFQIITADDFQERDPSTWELFGTNDLIASADNSTGTSETWTLIDTGTLALPSARNTYAPLQSIDGSTIPYSSYRIIFTDLHDAGSANSMQIAEIQFYGVLSGIQGDFDLDGDVDGLDFLIWQQGNGILSGATISDGDANNDGQVNGADLQLWQANYGSQSASLPAATTVPEPNCLILALLLGVMRLSWRR